MPRPVKVRFGVNVTHHCLYRVGRILHDCTRDAVRCQKRKCPGSRGTSVLPSGADIVSLSRHVRLVPSRDVLRFCTYFAQANFDRNCRPENPRTLICASNRGLILGFRIGEVPASGEASHVRMSRLTIAIISLLPLRTAPVVALLLLAIVPAAYAWEDTPRLRVYHLAYPIDWNGETIMIGTRLQLPLNANGKFPAVIMLHGTAGLSYNGVYYAAALNRAGIATLEVDQWSGRGLPGGASSRPKGLGDMVAASAAA